MRRRILTRGEVPWVLKGKDTVDDLPAAIPSEHFRMSSDRSPQRRPLPPDFAQRQRIIIREHGHHSSTEGLGAILVRGHIASSGEQAGRQEQDDAGGGMTVSWDLYNRRVRTSGKRH
ncbi:hypothetical protein ARMGADRAFT_818210 [Armillaria gallica]|uniref:Uncharacterized protein n=1 Tax=Armillaria gallica TaxID=47427 RepID=A0A2H3CGJ9_ARMGA|nr:hypothetical protein ARMGADRAFT_818210 [Armillaria gallica]